jgi:cell division initiation protein
MEGAGRASGPLPDHVDRLARHAQGSGEVTGVEWTAPDPVLPWPVEEAMKITPLDIQQKRFSRALRGYDREEVEAFLSLAASSFEDLVKELHFLREELQRRDEDLAAHRDLERTLQETLVTAQRASEEIRESARREGEIAIGEAELQAEKIVQGAHQRFLRIVDDIQEMKRLRVQFEASVRALVDGHAKLLDTFRGSDVEDPVEFLAGRKKGSGEG